MTPRTGSARRILGIWRKLVELRLDTEREGSTFACSWRPWTGVARERGRWKRQNRKNAYLSPCVEEPLNSKVIKSFVPELRSRKCFSCFDIPMFYLYGHSMYVSHIAISWLSYSFKFSNFLINRFSFDEEFRKCGTEIITSIHSIAGWKLTLRKENTGKVFWKY